jgi:hypothetical protein
MPRRRAAENLTVAHRERLRRPIRAAQRECADPGFRRFVEPRHVLLPGVGIAVGLAEIVVDDRAARRFGDARHQAVSELWRAAAAALDDAGAKLAQYIGEREDLVFVGQQCGNVLALRIVMAFVARHRKAERTGLHAVAHDVLHRLDFFARGGAFLALVAHDVVAHGRVSDQIADVDAKASFEPVHVLRDGLPLDRNGAEHLHRNRFDVGKKFRDALLGPGSYRRERERAIPEDDRGRAVLRREGAQRVPGDLSVEVTMVVDEAR